MLTPILVILQNTIFQKRDFMVFSLRPDLFWKYKSLFFKANHFNFNVFTQTAHITEHVTTAAEDTATEEDAQVPPTAKPVTVADLTEAVVDTQKMINVVMKDVQVAPTMEPVTVEGDAPDTVPELLLCNPLIKLCMVLLLKMTQKQQ